MTFCLRVPREIFSQYTLGIIEQENIACSCFKRLELRHRFPGVCPQQTIHEVIRIFRFRAVIVCQCFHNEESGKTDDTNYFDGHLASIQ